MQTWSSASTAVVRNSGWSDRHELRVERDHEHRGLRVRQLDHQPLEERLDGARPAVVDRGRLGVPRPALAPRGQPGPDAEVDQHAGTDHLERPVRRLGRGHQRGEARRAASAHRYSPSSSPRTSGTAVRIPCSAVRRRISAIAGPGEAEISSTARRTPAARRTGARGQAQKPLSASRSRAIASGGPSKVTSRSCGAAEEEQHQLGRPPGDHHRVVAPADVVASGAGPVRRGVRRSARRPCGSTSFADPLSSFQSSSSSARGQLAGLPAGPGPAQVLVVDEVLQRVGEPLDARQPVPRQPGVVELLDHLGERRAARPSPWPAR